MKGQLPHHQHAGRSPAVFTAAPPARRAGAGGLHGCTANTQGGRRRSSRLHRQHAELAPAVFTAAPPTRRAGAGGLHGCTASGRTYLLDPGLGHATSALIQALGRCWANAGPSNTGPC
eukprot:353675-Chlamydomonas_euryale.AAC.2